jgi:tetratricopeptide (TPR) repeat protein
VGTQRNFIKSGGFWVVALALAFGRAQAAPVPASDQDLTPTARALSDKGLRQYQDGDLDAAIESFMGAYALSNNGGLLFNVAQAYRLKKDCPHAREYYGRYLAAVPDSALKPSVERRLAEMETCSKPSGDEAPTAIGPAATSVASNRQGPPPETKPAATVTSPDPSKPAAEVVVSSRNHAVVWTLRGSAAALLTSSAIFGVLSWDAKRDYDASTTQRAAWDANDRFHRDTALTISFAASGLLCAVVSYFVGRHP